MTINARKENNRYGRSAPTCKFCGTQGHTMTKCPDMLVMYEEVKDKTIEERDFKGNFAVQYIEKRRGISKTGKSIPKKPKKCGYCRETGHNRRDCPQMVKDKEFIMKANRLWRKIWSDKATKYGLTPASLIKVTDRRYDYNQGGYVTKEFLCTVGAELPENLTVFALGEDSKKQEINIPLLGYKPEYGNHNVSARVLVNAVNESLGRALFSYSYSWGNIESVQLIARSSYEFTDEWLDDCPMEDINYALKKWTKEQMSDFLKQCKNLVEDYGGDYGIA